MLVDHLLLAVTEQNHHKVIKTGDDAPELETVHQKQGHRHLVPAHLIENSFLEIDRVRHMYSFFLLGYTNLTIIHLSDVVSICRARARISAVVCPCSRRSQ